MKIVNISPTPSPNTMKFTLNESKADNKSATYKSIDDNQPEFINALLAIDEVNSIFYALDFISIDKLPKADWEALIPKIKNCFEQEVTDVTSEKNKPIDHHVEVLFFKTIPYQIKVTYGDEETRKQLDVRFIDAMMKAQKDTDNVIFLRKWHDYGIRYGSIEDIINTIKEEIDALYPDEILMEKVQEALNTDTTVEQKCLERVSIETFNNEKDWKSRYRILDHYPKPTIEDLPFIMNALKDEKPQIRRLAVVFLGMLEDKVALEGLHQAMNDPNIQIRRTAGDTISDLGFKESLDVMHKALDDKSAIVRWRAAMFIYDEGDTTSLPYLEKHLNDDAFDVKLQVQQAYERIKNGEAAVGSVWKQIANRNE